MKTFWYLAVFWDPANPSYQYRLYTRKPITDEQNKSFANRGFVLIHESVFIQKVKVP